MYRPVSLTLVLQKVMEQIISSAIMQHATRRHEFMKEHEFMKDGSCLINLISFCDEVIHLVDEGNAIDVVYLDHSKAFVTVSNSIS